MPLGLLRDLWECHLQYYGIAKPLTEESIDDIIPYDLA